MSEPNIPHQSVICVTIYYELCEKQPDGKVGTRVKDKHHESIPFTICGDSLTECQEATKQFLTNLKERIHAKGKQT